MRRLIFTLLLALSVSLSAAEITHIETLQPGDPLWVSVDGENWEKVTFLRENLSPDCPHKKFTGADGYSTIVYQCETENYELQSWVWYTGGSTEAMNFITGRDPNSPPVSRQEIFGLQDRIRNILYAKDLDSAMGTIRAIYADRNRLIEVHEVVREELKKE